jgi:hypothetical protein
VYASYIVPINAQKRKQLSNEISEYYQSVSSTPVALTWHDPKQGILRHLFAILR